jgi:hypothetical protein
LPAEAAGTGSGSSRACRRWNEEAHHAGQRRQLNYGIGHTNQVGLINVSALNGDFSGNSFGW